MLPAEEIEEAAASYRKLAQFDPAPTAPEKPRRKRQGRKRRCVALMMELPLTVTSIMAHAKRHHPEREVVTATPGR